jgi:aldehyde dehydrogenase (NAD+)/retinal dehydrogenase
MVNGVLSLVHRELLDPRLIDILTLDSLTTGNPVSLIPTREKNYIKGCLMYYAGWKDKQRGDYFPADDGFVKLVRHEPPGVCAAINPYNSPVASFIIMKAVTMLGDRERADCQAFQKGPLGSLAIAPLFEEAGFPAGVVQVVTGAGPTEALLAEHMRVRKISFTGSVATGKKFQVAAAHSNLKRVTLELGGKLVRPSYSKTQTLRMHSRGRSMEFWPELAKSALLLQEYTFRNR